MELFAATSFGRIATRRTSMSDAFSAPRMRTPLGPSRTSWSLHQTASISDTLIVTRRHARVSLCAARCAGRDTFLADRAATLTCESEDPTFLCS